MVYIILYSLAMGASLAVILENVRVKMFETSLQKPERSENISRFDQNGKCKNCHRRGTFRGRGVECESCKNWFQAKCRKITNEENANMQDVVWISTYGSSQQTEGWFEEMELFKMYVDDFIWTVRGDPDEYLKFSNSLHKKLQFALEEINMEEGSAFLDINVNVSCKSSNTCHWYQKPTDTGVILNFLSCAALQHKTHVIQGKIHSVVKRLFDQALRSGNRKEQNWLDQKPVSEEWSSKIVKQTLKKIITGSKDQLRTTTIEHHNARLDLIMNQLFSTIQRQPYSKLCHQIEKIMGLASGFHNPKNKIMPPHPGIMFQ